LILRSFVQLGYTTRYTIAPACAAKAAGHCWIGVFDQLGRGSLGYLAWGCVKTFPLDHAYARSRGTSILQQMPSRACPSSDSRASSSATPTATLVESDELDNRRKALASALCVLNNRERRIFEARRLAENPITLEEIADEFGVSGERVRQIEVRAFEKVQHAVRNRRLINRLACLAFALTGDCVTANSNQLHDATEHSFRNTVFNRPVHSARR
jgi:Sigma-70, region 4